MPRFFTLLMVLSCLVWWTSCDIADNEVEPGMSFTQIYDDRSSTTEYDPLSLVQTEDGGYLALAATNAWNGYLLKTDSDGQFIWEIHVDEAYVNPLETIIQADDQYYIVCMNEVTLAATILHVDLAAQTATPILEVNEVQYPLAVSQTADQTLLMLGYHQESRSSTLHAFNATFGDTLTTTLTANWSKRYAVEEDIEEEIVEHISRTGRRLPFMVGASADGQSYYFNGFANYTLGLNFVNPQNGDLLGTMNGFRDGAFVNAAHPLQGNQYALARSNFGVNALLPLVEVDPGAVASSSELPANDFPEIDSDARIVVHEIVHQTQPMILFATHTKKRQLIFYAYDKVNGTLLGTQYLGQTNPYQVGDFVMTEDGGLAVLAETFLAGRFSRPCLFKLSADEVDAFVRQQTN